MKKALSLVLAVVMVFALVACGGNNNTPATNDTPTTNNTPATNDTPSNNDASAAGGAF